MKDAKYMAFAWIGATIVAALTMVSFLTSQTYSRAEGQNIEKRVDKIEVNIDNRLTRIENKLDTLSQGR